MSKIVWNEIPSDVKIEFGIDNGVLYPVADGDVVPWNGLVTVNETGVGSESEPIYYDGVKRRQLIGSKNYQATVTALNEPRTLSQCLGEAHVVPGFILTNQLRLPFNFSYRSRVDKNNGYKIHLVYNATASRTGRSAATITESIPVTSPSWTIDAVPPPGNALWTPTAHFVIEKSRVEASRMAAFESYLYGTVDTDPMFPTVEMLIDLFVGTPG